MCIIIEEVTAYRVDGKLYATELEAVRSVIKGIGDTLIKNNHANIGEGIIGHADVLLDMLGRYRHLAPTPTAETPEKPQEDPSNG